MHWRWFYQGCAFGFSGFRVGLGKTRVGSEFGRAAQNFLVSGRASVGKSENICPNAQPWPFFSWTTSSEAPISSILSLHLIPTFEYECSVFNGITLKGLKLLLEVSKFKPTRKEGVIIFHIFSLKNKANRLSLRTCPGSKIIVRIRSVHLKLTLED